MFSTKTQLTVQDTQVHEDTVELLNTIRSVHAAAAAFDRGEGRPIEEAFAEMDERFKQKFTQARNHP